MGGARLARDTDGRVRRQADGRKRGRRQPCRRGPRPARTRRTSGATAASATAARASAAPSSSLLCEIAPALVGLDPADQALVDGTMRDLDGTPNLGRLGANAVLAASVACALAEASSRSLPFWRAPLPGPAAAAAAADGERHLRRRPRRRARRRPGLPRRPGRSAHVRGGDRVGVAGARRHRSRPA